MFDRGWSVFLLACHLASAPYNEAPLTPVPAWSIYDGSVLVLTVRGEPGAITSTAPPPRGMQPVLHPFLSAAAREAGHESQLKEILDASVSTEDFLDTLRAAGFRVVEG